MVRPAHFAFNAQTAASNVFQRSDAGGTDIAARAREEFTALCDALAGAGVRACIVEDSPEPPKPDAVFPNNWVSWHADGTVVLYPMQAINRRAERRRDILDAVEAQTCFPRRRLLDLTHHEQVGRYLEGTGSLVIDPLSRRVFACRSPRTSEPVLQEWAALLQYEPVAFDAFGPEGKPIYHTNVMLALGQRWAIVCTAAIARPDRERVLEGLRAGGRQLIEIDVAALQGFAANILELPAAGRTVLAMSVRARAALAARPFVWETLTHCVDEVIAVPVPTIEHVGGGSVRCMLAQVPSVAS